MKLIPEKKNFSPNKYLGIGLMWLTAVLLLLTACQPALSSPPLPTLAATAVSQVTPPTATATIENSPTREATPTPPPPPPSPTSLTI
ncbi:MAG: hypothetical protein H6658_16025 [Ardenticatenaceae bacterium]|nr:hypothetical protein [Ardenticatenaceae bacterium]